MLPTIGKGISEGLKKDGTNVLGQIANNMGENGATIVIKDRDIDGQLEKILGNANVLDGNLVLTTEEASKIEGLLKQVLSEYDKDHYEIGLVGDLNSSASMAINDKTGVMNINLLSLGFGNVSNLLNSTMHEGGHGTYVNNRVDEIAASRLGGN